MITIDFFKGLPFEYESFLLEKYDSFITTNQYIKVYYPFFNVNYMLVYENGNLIELLIFGNDGKTSRCFNSLVEIDQNVVIECTKKLFEIYPEINKIYIDASYQNYFLNKSILCFQSSDLILTLPSTIEDYLLKLGPNTRYHIKNRNTKLLRDYPEIKFVTKYGNEIEKNIIDKIIKLNYSRMKHKGIVPGISDTEKNNIYKYSQYYGCVNYIELDKVIIGGCISTILNKETYLHVYAHDNNFSKYNIGEACVFYLIKNSIEKGIFKFHFLWGENELKRRFLGKSHPLFSYIIFRSYSLEYILNYGKILSYRAFARLKQSQFSVPIKNTIKHIRKRKWQD